MKSYVCKICGEQFFSESNYAKYCSDDCKAAGRQANYRKDIEYTRMLSRKNANAYHERNRDEVNRKKRERRVHTMYEKTCIHCGEVFTTKRNDKVSCGKRDKLHRPNEEVKMEVVMCEYCGKIFYKPVSTYNKDIRNGKPQGCCQLHTFVLNGSTLSLTCSECGKVFERPRSQHIEGQKHDFCSKECQDANIDYILRGEDHYHYIDGKSSGYRGKGWNKIRKRIRERDNHTCYLCKTTRDELGKELDVHHLIRFEDFEDEDEANDGRNLISLCPSCHHTEEHANTISHIVPIIRECKERMAA